MKAAQLASKNDCIVALKRNVLLIADFYRFACVSRFLRMQVLLHIHICACMYICMCVVCYVLKKKIICLACSKLVFYASVIGTREWH